MKRMNKGFADAIDKIAKEGKITFTRTTEELTPIIRGTTIRIGPIQKKKNKIKFRPNGGDFNL